MPKGIFREALAEFLGTFVLIALGVAVVAQVVGAFVASSVVYLTYREALNAFDARSHSSARFPGASLTRSSVRRCWLG